MPEHIFSVVTCGYSVDVQSNTLTLFSIVEQVNSPVIPFNFPGFTLVTLWHRNDGEEGATFEQQTRLLDPDNNQVSEFSQSFVMNRLRCRVISQIVNVPFRKTGLYNLEVYIRSEDSQEWSGVVARYPISVAIVESEHEPSLLSTDEDKPSA